MATKEEEKGEGFKKKDRKKEIRRRDGVFFFGFVKGFSRELRSEGKKVFVCFWWYRRGKGRSAIFWCTHLCTF